MKKTDILAVNPGSTTTKVGVFRCDAEDGRSCGMPGPGGGLSSLTELFVETITHNPNHLLQFGSLEAQLPYRKEVILSVLKERGYDLGQLRAIVGRGGQINGLKSGAYEVTPEFCQDMMNPQNVQHASNLGAPLAYDLSAPLEIPSYIYDSTRGCELSDVAKISGVDGIERFGNCHVLNSRAQAINYANSIGRSYKDLNLIVCHMGGGITVTAHQDGKIIDDDSFDEGPMSPERTGGVQLTSWTTLCFSGKYTEEEMQKLICGGGGLFSYLGVTDCRRVEEMIREGDGRAATVYEGMAYQVAKSIASMTVPLLGKVDAIIMTGGAAHAPLLNELIMKYAGHLGHFVRMPGEDELEALAAGAVRVLDGLEQVNEYDPL